MAGIPQENMVRSIGDLAKDDDQMIIILHAVHFRNAHVMSGHSNKGVSCIFSFFLSYCC
jgi:hypothetical protein